MAYITRAMFEAENIELKAKLAALQASIAPLNAELEALKLKEAIMTRNLGEIFNLLQTLKQPVVEDTALKAKLLDTERQLANAQMQWAQISGANSKLNYEITQLKAELVRYKANQ
jgi:uncharacterized small protein (DUF1192 family)